MRKIDLKKNRIMNGKAAAIFAVLLLVPSLCGCGVDDFLNTPMGQKVMGIMIGDDWAEDTDSASDHAQDADFWHLKEGPKGKLPWLIDEADEDAAKEIDGATDSTDELSSKDGAENSRDGSSKNGAASDASKTDDTSNPESEDVPAMQTVDEIPMTDEEMELACEGMRRYGYSKLSDADRVLYREIYVTLIGHKKDKTLTSKNADQIDRVFQVVMADHPEIYYVSGYTLNKYMLGDKVTSIHLTGKYDHSAEECEAFEPRIKNYVSQCLADVPDTGDDYDKVKYIYEYLVEHTNYNLNAKENQNILSVFLYGQSVCNGYAQAAQYLLNSQGIPCLKVSGTVKNGESHAWNIVYVNGNWSVLDVTWGDATYRTRSTERTNDISYDYLCANDEIMNRTHRAASLIELPVCDTLDDYYFVREGTYIGEVDAAQIETAFQTAYAQGRSSLTLKCDTYDHYVSLNQYLIDEEHIYDLMKTKDGGISYARLPDNWGLIFYL